MSLLNAISLTQRTSANWKKTSHVVDIAHHEHYTGKLHFLGISVDLGLAVA
jgi:hypothetical protein